MQKVASGDLSFRLNVFPFSILSGSIYKFADRHHKIVQLVEKSPEGFTLAANEFREHACNRETLARAQRQHLDFLASRPQQANVM